MADMTRRAAIKAGAVAAAAAQAPALAAARPADVAVIGAGVFGACTARALQRAGRRVTLIDAWGPAHARASSGGESRLTRGSYGADEVYTRMAWESLAEWRALSARGGMPLFPQAGGLFFFPRAGGYLRPSVGGYLPPKLPRPLMGRGGMRRGVPLVDLPGGGLGP